MLKRTYLFGYYSLASSEWKQWTRMIMSIKSYVYTVLWKLVLDFGDLYNLNVFSLLKQFGFLKLKSVEVSHILILLIQACFAIDKRV